MRHGQCLDALTRPDAHARPDSPLTIGGGLDVRSVAHGLLNQHWQPEIIISSPLRRAKKTAEIVSEVTSCKKIEEMEELEEWKAPHCAIGKAPRDYPKEYLFWRKIREKSTDTALPGGESLLAFYNRVVKVNAVIYSRSKEYSRLLVISHRLLIGAVAAYNAGCCQPREIFSNASAFELSHSGLWHMTETRD